MTKPNFADMMKKMPTFDAQAFTKAFDFSALVATGRRNFEAMTAASQMVTESTQAMARRQMETARTSMEQALTTTREMFNGQNPEMNLARQTEMAKTAMESAMQNLREMSDMATKSSFEAAKMLQERLTASMQEVQQAAAKK